jgi:shikimate kinase
MNNIILIGFCSCGKSATAYELAKRLNMKFVDLDKEIEVRYYLKYGEELHYRNIILKQGAELFFEIENEFLSELTWFQDCVIAPGGGTPLREEKQLYLSKLGTIIYLKADPEVTYKRMQAKGLPLFLRDNPTMENLKRIWTERDKVYLSFAHHVVDNSYLSIMETADQIIAILEKHGVISSQSNE